MGLQLFDSVNAADIPADADHDIVAFYVDGHYANGEAIKARFPDAYYVPITVTGLHGVRVADVENGDLNPTSGAAWALGETWNLRRPTLYFSYALLTAVTQALAVHGLTLGRDVDWWCAKYDDNPALPFPAAAKQYEDPSFTHANFDLSSTNGIWPMNAPAATSAPAAPVHSAPAQPVCVGLDITPSGNGYWEVGRDGGVFGYGDAPFHGSCPGNKITVNNIVGIAGTNSGQGYWVVGSDGGVFAFGDAAFHGSMGGHVLNAPVIGIRRSPDGNGYILFASDFGIFAFGDAKFEGTTEV